MFFYSIQPDLLHEYAKFGSFSALTRILEEGTHGIDRENDRGWTALIMAAHYGHRQYVVIYIYFVNLKCLQTSTT